MLVPLLIHLLLLALALIIVIAPFRSQKGELARWSDLWWWLGVGILPLFILPFLANYPAENHFFAYALAGFCAFFGFYGGLSTIWRIGRKQPRSRHVGALIATSILSLLFLALLLPALTPAREAAARTGCRNNLKQIGLAMDTYHDAYGTFPAAISGEGTLAVSWRVRIEPYLDASPLEPRYDDHFAWNAEPNWPITKRRIPTFECPTAIYRRTGERSEFGPTDYAALVGPETAFPPDHATQIGDITDGTSNTLMIVEAVNRGIRWAEPKDIYVTSANPIVRSTDAPQKLLNPLISSAHTGGGHVLMVDGTVRFISARIDPAVLEVLTTRRGGEPVPEY
jgi:hypothetical protein